VLWNENNQFAADSIQFFFLNNELFRADLFSSAFIISQEDDPLLFNQIKGNDMIGYFRDKDIYRFDVLGAAEAIFCIREDSLISSLNKKESRDLIITLKDRQVQKVVYQGNTKSVLYPLYNIQENEQKLSHFNWRDDDRPKDRFAITSLSLRPSEAAQVSTVAQPTFRYTRYFFPGHPIPVVQRKSPPEKKKAESSAIDSLPGSIIADTTQIAIPIDTLVTPQSDSLTTLTLQRDSLATTHTIFPKPDSLATTQTIFPKPDSTATTQTLFPKPDSLATTQTLFPKPDSAATMQTAIESPLPTKKEIRAQRKAIKREEAALRKAQKREQAAQRKAERLARKQARNG